MGKGRAPCCDKSQVKRGPWSTSEDLRLITFIQKHGHDNWRALPKQAGLLRCGKSCRLRWINYLRPDLKRGNFTKQEEDTIIKLHQVWGNKWSKIASQLPGRTDNEIKNVWNTHLKRRLSGKSAKSHGEEMSSITSSSSSSSSTFTSCGKENTDVGSERQSDKASTGQNPHMLTHLEKEEGPFHAAKDPREQTSSSVSSYDSNASNSSPVAVSRPEEHMVSLLHYGGPYEANNMLEEVNRPYVMDDVLEVPLEADAEFWNMLDNLDSVLPNSIQSAEADACQTPNSGEGNGKEVENDKWLRYLESELGLDAVGEENKEMSAKEAAVPLVPESFPCQIFSMPEPGPDMSCLPMLPSWSQTSAI